MILGYVLALVVHSVQYKYIVRGNWHLCMNIIRRSDAFWQESHENQTYYCDRVSYSLFLCAYRSSRKHRTYYLPKLWCRTKTFYFVLVYLFICFCFFVYFSAQNEFDSDLILILIYTLSSYLVWYIGDELFFARHRRTASAWL